MTKDIVSGVGEKVDTASGGVDMLTGRFSRVGDPVCSTFGDGSSTCSVSERIGVPGDHIWFTREPEPSSHGLEGEYQQHKRKVGEDHHG